MAVGPARGRHAARHLLGSAALIAALALVNVGLSRVPARLELGDDSALSLTAASKRLLGELEAPLEVTAYFGKIPIENALGQQYVQLLLDEYVDAGGGKVSWVEVDPFERDAEFQEKLEKEHGIEKLRWISSVDGTPQQIAVYFHLLFRYQDRTEVWQPPARFSLEGLEYELSSAIQRVVHPHKNRVAVTTGFGSADHAEAIRVFLQEFYDVVLVDLAAPDLDLSDCDVVILNGPTQSVSRTAQAAIENHLMRGKPALLLLRGMVFATPPRPEPTDPTDPSASESASPHVLPFIGMPGQHALGPWLSHYGILVRQDLILDREASTPGGVPLGDQVAVKPELFPMMDVLAGGRLEPLAGLTVVPMPYASTVELAGDFATKRGGQLAALPLTRSAASAVRTESIVSVTHDSELQPGGGAPRGPFATGIALEGQLPRFFGDDPVNAPTGAADAGSSPPGTRLIVFGSADFVGDGVLGIAQRSPLFRGLGTARVVLLNMVDWLTQDQSLMPARAKGAPHTFRRPNADARALITLANCAGTAALILLLGVTVWLIRQRRRRHFAL